jgi:hypothetical protein
VAAAPKGKKQKKTALGEPKKEAVEEPEAACEVDQHYAKLHCGLTALEPSSTAYKQMEQYVENTKASLGSYKYEKWPKLSIKSVFEVRREGEAERFAPQKKALGHNRKMLWHGAHRTAQERFGIVQICGHLSICLVRLLWGLLACLQVLPGL